MNKTMQINFPKMYQLHWRRKTSTRNVLMETKISGAGITIKAEIPSLRITCFGSCKRKTLRRISRNIGMNLKGV